MDMNKIQNVTMEELDNTIVEMAKKVSPLFIANSFTWRMGGGDKVPTIEEIMEYYRELTAHAIREWLKYEEEYRTIISSGRLIVTIFGNPMIEHINFSVDVGCVFISGLKSMNHVV